jgi:hypothetical protein
MRVAETVLFAATATGAALAQVIAEAAPPAFPQIDLGNLTATGILGWYAWHTASRTIPGLVKDFREEAREQREAFMEEMRIERQSHRDEVLDIRRWQADTNPAAANPAAWLDK